MTNKPNNPFQEYSNCCGSLMDNDQTMCPECLEPCEKETRDERGMTWQTEFERLSQINNGYYEQKGMLVGCDQCGGNLDKEAVKAFIQDLLDRKAREIEELRKESGDETWTIDAYSQAIDKALSILKER